MLSWEPAEAEGAGCQQVGEVCSLQAGAGSQDGLQAKQGEAAPGSWVAFHALSSRCPENPVSGTLLLLH